MRPAVLFLALALVLPWLAGASPARASEPDRAAAGALGAVQALERLLDEEDAAWAERWRAYRAAKDAIDEAEGSDKEAAEAAYATIRPRVADALRRDNLGVAGWLMGFFGASLLWGGLAFCIGIARKSGGGAGGA